MMWTSRSNSAGVLAIIITVMMLELPLPALYVALASWWLVPDRIERALERHAYEEAR